MSFKGSELSVLAYANNFTLWHYTTLDSAVTGLGYFNAATDMLRVNDLMLCNIGSGQKPCIKFYVVVGNSGGKVAIADMQGEQAEPAPEPEAAFDWATIQPGMAFIDTDGDTARFLAKSLNGDGKLIFQRYGKHDFATTWSPAEVPRYFSRLREGDLPGVI